ncbi:tryptophan 2,3-dioxygenase family protein [Chitinophaga sedimenti]|uniref:tryptophan 2,3-dioxygenase family protein n=1 Tax=Chitinophaga sedimenti TaxID=2033606 RepID=UPI00200604D2|nr:tryptophan 2,3-dioxygenase family protein [Chitinophaga sedimenti]MCK7558233.1 tryptophan 2,3-dioxygenase family protein [Chitinophaga sedimenti]
MELNFTGGKATGKCRVIAYSCRMVTTEIAEKIKLLEEKYAAMGQDLSSYLDGLLYADYLTYWDYIGLDVLLNLQHPRTPIPDENIFIIYHQITELYFKLSLQAIAQVCTTESTDEKTFETQIRRVNNYFRNLIRSFEIMVDGMDKDQFLQFRMALLPASGFQSGQFRMIEITSAPLKQLVYEPHREGLVADDLPSVLDKIYWRGGATELATGKKTLTLRQFERKYMDQFLKLATEYKGRTVADRYYSLPADARAPGAAGKGIRSQHQRALATHALQIRRALPAQRTKGNRGYRRH